MLFRICAAAAIVYFAIIVSRRQPKRLDDFMTRFGLPVEETGQTASKIEDSIEIHYQVWPLGRGKKPPLSLWFEYPNAGHLAVRRETWADRLFKHLGIVAEVQTNDRAFDENYFVDSAEPQFGRTFLSNSKTRKYFRNLRVLREFSDARWRNDLLGFRTLPPARCFGSFSTQFGICMRSVYRYAVINNFRLAREFEFALAYLY